MVNVIEQESVCLLNLRIKPVGMADAVQMVIRAARAGSGGHVCLANSHTVGMAQSDSRLREASNSALLTLADGRPLVWAARLLGASRPCQVRGADLLRETCAAAARESIPVYFYGGAPTVTPRLVEVLSRELPDLIVSGFECPPFRAPTTEEDRETVDRISSSGARILWVGLGAPKQEIWMLNHQDSLPGLVMLGVGAAFDFKGGAIPEAPPWMRTSGLEWLHRLFQDPKRLWGRYLIFNTRFAVQVGAQVVQRWMTRGRPARVNRSEGGEN